MTDETDPAAPALRSALRTLVESPPPVAPERLERALRAGRAQVRRRRAAGSLTALAVLAAAGGGATVLAGVVHLGGSGATETVQAAGPRARGVLGPVLGPPIQAAPTTGVPACATSRLSARYAIATTVEHGQDSLPGTVVTLTVTNTGPATCSLDNDRAQGAAQLASASGATLKTSAAVAAVAYPDLLLPPGGVARWEVTWLSWCAARPAGFRVGYNDGYTAVRASRVFPAREVPACSAAAFAAQNATNAPGIVAASTWTAAPGSSHAALRDWASPAGQICLSALPGKQVVSATQTTVGAIRAHTIGPPSGGSPDAPAAHAFPGLPANSPAAWCWTTTPAAGPAAGGSDFEAWGATRGEAVAFVGLVNPPGPGVPSGPPSFPSGPPSSPSGPPSSP